MNTQTHSIFLLARPSYQRNGIAATLLSLPEISLRVLDGQAAAQALRLANPDLLVVYPRGLEQPFVQAVCERYPEPEWDRLLVIVDMYTGESELSLWSAFPFQQIDTPDQLKELVREKLHRRTGQPGTEYPGGNPS